MIGRIAIALSLLVFAAGVLAASIFRTITPQYAFSQTARPGAVLSLEKEPVEYYLPYPGILPDHFLWPLKAARDQIWLFLTTDSLKKGEIYLLFADKRLGAAKALLEGGKTELAIPTLTKAEMYLESAAEEERKARGEGKDTGSLPETLALASLKHREILEELYIKAPDEARPIIAEALNSPKNIYDNLKSDLRSLGKPIPPSPFEP